ncbi:MAG TPA: hypothetical protein VHJ76_02050 [Actinomycetota bacterium]|nr:hypothetical protein [Actinomycetota bacterium]
MPTDPQGDVLVAKLVEMHPGWDLVIEPPPAGPARGFARQRDGAGRVRYAFGEDERGSFLEFYSFHRVWGDLHARIRADGTVEELDVLETAVATTGDPGADRRAAEAQNRRNRRLLKELDDAGLLSGGPVPASFEVDAALASGLLDEDDPADG